MATRLRFVRRIAVNNTNAARIAMARVFAGAARKTYTPGATQILRFLSGAFIVDSCLPEHYSGENRERVKGVRSGKPARRQLPRRRA